MEEEPEEAPVETKKKKSKEQVEEAPVEAETEAKPKKKKRAAAETVEEPAEASSSAQSEENGASKKTPKMHIKTDSINTTAAKNFGVDEMEEMAAKSARTPRGLGQESPRLADPVVDPAKSNRAHLATSQTDVERKKIESLPRLYVNVTEVKGTKPGAYYVEVNFGVAKEAEWTSEVTKKSTTWENKGRLLPIPKGSTHVTITLYSKGLIGALDAVKGEAVWDLKALSDSYPHQPWAPMLKKSETKAQLRVQLMYLPENVDLDGDEFITPLHALIRKQKLDLLTRAVEDIFADLSLTDADGRTPLHLAVQMNKPKFVKLLIKALKGEGAALVTPKKETALHYAAQYASGSIAKQLVAAGFDVNALADLKRTPLHYAAAAGNVEVIDVLAAVEGVVLDNQDKIGNTPLGEALISDRAEAVAALVGLGCDLYIENDKELKVWEVALRKDMVNMEARKAFMEAAGVNDGREFPLRAKFPRRAVVKGAKVGLDYEDSDQFAISVAEPMEVAIILTANDVIASSNFAQDSAFALVKSDQGEHHELAISRDTIAFSGNRAVTIKLEPNFFYVVVPYAKTETAATDFALVVMTPKKKSATITPLKRWAHSAVCESKWEGKTAGGAQPAPTWVDNPQFELAMPQEDDVKFAVLLSQEENDTELRYVDGDDHRKLPYDHPVGFYLCDRGGVKVLEQVEKWTNSRDVHQEFQMDFSQRNHLCIIPTMHAPGTEGPFTLRVFCDKPITLSPK